jgi:hypothetical protein
MLMFIFSYKNIILVEKNAEFTWMAKVIGSLAVVFLLRLIQGKRNFFI